MGQRLRDDLKVNERAGASRKAVLAAIVFLFSKYAGTKIRLLRREFY